MRDEREREGLVINIKREREISDKEKERKSATL